MAQAEKVFRGLIEEIAKEKSYNNYSVIIKPLSSGGANYSSVLFLATVSAPGKDDLNLFAKAAALGKEMRASIHKDFYMNEPYFYSNILKRYREIEEKYNVAPEDRLVTAKFYAASAEYMHETLVLEDLTARGFKSFNRFQSIDWAYASYSIKQLALFHALSIAYSKEYPAEYENTVKSKLTTFPADIMTNSLEKAFDQAISSVKEKNKGRLSKWLENPKIRRPVHKIYSPSGVSVIAHGDFRPNNMMHKTLNDGTMQVITLDYQTLQEGYPVADLLYFIFLGSDKKFRDQYLQKSIELYYLELSSALRRFNLNPDEIYSKKTYQQDLKELIPYMLSYSLLLVLIVTVDEDAAPEVGEEFTMDSMNVSPNNLYAERINDLIDDFIDIEIL